MNLEPKRDNITTQKEFLNTTQGMVAKVGGVTLDASAFTGLLDSSGYLLAGSGVALLDSGLAVPFELIDADSDTQIDDPNGIPFVTQNDVKVDGANVIVGALESAYLNESVVGVTEPGRIAVTQDFIDASNGRFHLR